MIKIYKYVNLILKQTSLVRVSMFVVADIPVRSPRKLFVLIIKHHIFAVKVSLKQLCNFKKQNHWFVPSASRFLVHNSVVSGYVDRSR